MRQFSYILYKLASAPARWPYLFNAICLGSGSFLCTRYLRGHAFAETVALVLLGAVAAVPVAILFVAIFQKAASRMVDEEIRRETEKARKAHEDRYQRRLTRFLEDCIEEEGDTPVWKSESEQ